MDLWKDKWVDGGQLHEMIGGWMDGWTDRSLEGQTDYQLDGRISRRMEMDI